MRSVLLWFGLLATSSAPAAIVGVAGGTAAPPPALGPYTMTRFPDDARPTFQQVISVASPLGGELLFSDPLWHMEIGDGWKWWSHGYTGDVYFRPDTGKPASYSLILPAKTKAFYLYAGHDLDSGHYITVTAEDGTSVTQPIGGDLVPAAYFGFYVDDPAGPDLEALTVSAPVSISLAVGEFGIAIPEPGALILLTVGLLAVRRR